MRQSKNFKSSNITTTSGPSRNSAISNNNSANASFGKKTMTRKSGAGASVMISPTNHQQSSARSSTRRGNISATSLNPGVDNGITASNFDIGQSANAAANNDLLMMPSIANPDEDFGGAKLNDEDEDENMMNANNGEEEEDDEEAGEEENEEENDDEEAGEEEDDQNDEDEEMEEEDMGEGEDEDGLRQNIDEDNESSYRQ